VQLAREFATRIRALTKTVKELDHQLEVRTIQIAPALLNPAQTGRRADDGNLRACWLR
jgi:hypothetical protein